MNAIGLNSIPSSTYLSIQEALATKNEIINKSKNDCGHWDLNPGPSDLQSDALPTELCPRYIPSKNYCTIYSQKGESSLPKNVMFIKWQWTFQSSITLCQNKVVLNQEKVLSTSTKTALTSRYTELSSIT